MYLVRFPERSSLGSQSSVSSKPLGSCGSNSSKNMQKKSKKSHLWRPLKCKHIFSLLESKKAHMSNQKKNLGGEKKSMPFEISFQGRAEVQHTIIPCRLHTHSFPKQQHHKQAHTKVAILLNHHGQQSHSAR